ncbi:MAG: hypothetical protein WBE37_31600 [Bryobacteraceae bacterium]
MKKLSLMILLFSASLVAQDFSGIWNGKGGIESTKYGVVPQTAQMTLLQAGSTLQGTFKLGNSKPIAISSGSVSGTQLNLIVGQGLASGTLTQNGGELTGKMTSSSGQVMDFVFTKQ